MKLITIYDPELGWKNKQADILTDIETGFIYPAVVKIKNGYSAHDAKTGISLGVVGDKEDIINQLKKGLPSITIEKWQSSLSNYLDKNPNAAIRPDTAKEYLTDAEITEKENKAEAEKYERSQTSKFCTLVRQNIVSGGLRAAELQLEYLTNNKDAKVADGFTTEQAIGGYQKAIAEHKENQR